MIGVTALSIALLATGQKLVVGQAYDCQVTKVVTATQFWATLRDGPPKPIFISLPGVVSAPRRSWAFEAGRQYLFEGFGPGDDKRHLLPTKVQIRSLPRAGQAVADLYYVGRRMRDPGPADFSVTEDLLKCGFARVTDTDKTRCSLQALAQRTALGMWTKKLQPIKRGDRFEGAALEAITPTRFVVARSEGYGFNTTPTSVVRLANLLAPPKNSPAYHEALDRAKHFCGRLRRDMRSGRVDFEGNVTRFSITSIDRGGAAACEVSYTTFSPDTPNGMFRSEDHDLAEEMLAEGLVRIDPKAGNVSPKWVQCEAKAKAAHKGLWAA